MIYETIVTTQNRQGQLHIAPMGIHEHGNDILILPFKPSSTLDNILATGVGVLNFCEDVRVFAGCLTGRKEWPVVAAVTITGSYLTAALAHSEFELIRMEDDPERPKLFCRSVHEANHRAFKGFNRAQFSVLEAAILVSRLGMLPTEKIERELDYLRIGLDKTAGKREQEAWNWLMDAVHQFKTGTVS